MCWQASASWFGGGAVPPVCDAGEAAEESHETQPGPALCLPGTPRVRSRGSSESAQRAAQARPSGEGGTQGGPASRRQSSGLRRLRRSCNRVSASLLVDASSVSTAGGAGLPAALARGSLPPGIHEYVRLPWIGFQSGPGSRAVQTVPAPPPSGSNRWSARANAGKSNSARWGRRWSRPGIRPVCSDLS